ncbi:AAA family ATPase [Chamaesiphon polymorphus]|uniref:Chromosome partitioning protein ParA n=1 Tax=Chamaesiphon polymorphus CCALA 037 TaxID=2107692 RepID=A0A2T1GIB0_9CYAN|nr:AAA family ATPase [Chamaesiphon polymorphus]PSB57456.1 chromosome partitioning protein ParA [Chamaesiphon polymorphus CCALA 037]
MILVCGGIKGGVGKTTLATSMVVLRSATGRDVLLVDADDQATATDFTAVRTESLTSAGYTSIQLHGAAVRNEVLKLAPKYDDIVIDVGGRDTAGQRAALLVADVYVVPFLPGSFDVWTLDSVGTLVEEAKAFNDKLKAVCVINRADAKGSDNQDAAEIASEIPGLVYIDAPLGNRKAFRAAAAQGLAVTEMKPQDAKAISELNRLFQHLFSI